MIVQVPFLHNIIHNDLLIPHTHQTHTHADTNKARPAIKDAKRSKTSYRETSFFKLIDLPQIC